ncbi:hypothetical protein DEO72_LG11g1216 [Vigna unguiculata]|uniref:Uncharacterized protein n=1 Tax=Vigna unguiculata TaxID=3917 RepID=A0A4D6NR12_VIGUN|nr:hypothetical protein DEO72_LG11g1216 [Vigna unguiculata]
MGWGVLGCGPNTTGLRVAGGMPAVSLSQTPKTPDRALLELKDYFIFELDTVVLSPTHYLSWWSCCAWVTFSELLLPSLAPKKIREARF